ncbi:hypothetical protein DCM91_11905 [Chitinophaga costaii]|nr:hypothetical protein DCM91_11905 [Chitinophaga costaii]
MTAKAGCKGKSQWEGGDWIVPVAVGHWKHKFSITLKFIQILPARLVGRSLASLFQPPAKC